MAEILGTIVALMLLMEQPAPAGSKNAPTGIRGRIRAPFARARPRAALVARSRPAGKGGQARRDPPEDPRFDEVAFLFLFPFPFSLWPLAFSLSLVRCPRIPPANDTILCQRAEQHEDHEGSVRPPGLLMRE